MRVCEGKEVVQVGSEEESQSVTQHDNKTHRPTVEFVEPFAPDGNRLFARR